MNNRLLQLSKGDLVEFRDARGTTLRVTRGTLWVTQERDALDVALRAGDAWTVERHGLTVVEAQGDATIVVTGSGLVDASVRSGGARWYDRLTAWVELVGEQLSRRRWVPRY